jgi:hypothetical protein
MRLWRVTYFLIMQQQTQTHTQTHTASVIVMAMCACAVCTAGMLFASCAAAVFMALLVVRMLPTATFRPVLQWTYVRVLSALLFHGTVREDVVRSGIAGLAKLWPWFARFHDASLLEAEFATGIPLTAVGLPTADSATSYVASGVAASLLARLNITTHQLHAIRVCFDDTVEDEDGQDAGCEQLDTQNDGGQSDPAGSAEPQEPHPHVPLLVEDVHQHEREQHRARKRRGPRRREHRVPQVP